MGGDAGGTESSTDPAGRVSVQRATLVQLLEDLPETRLSKPTPRQGWTLRHELSWLAASDQELLQRLDPDDESTRDEEHWRRVRGQAMHAAQELRLAALREHLKASGARVTAILEAQTTRLEERPIREAVGRHLEHGTAALNSLRGVLAK